MASVMASFSLAPVARTVHEGLLTAHTVQVGRSLDAELSCAGADCADDPLGSRMALKSAGSVEPRVHTLLSLSGFHRAFSMASCSVSPEARTANEGSLMLTTAQVVSLLDAAGLCPCTVGRNAVTLKSLFRNPRASLAQSLQCSRA